MSWSDGLAPGSPAYLIAASTNSRVRVLAGPGTGKSFAMKRRVVRLLEDGWLPAVILPVTFTKVAAEDLHRELVGMGVPGCEDLDGVTLHSLALRVLMRNHVLAATGRKPRPLNDFELEPLFYDLMRTHGGKKSVKKRKQAYEAAWARLQNEDPGFIVEAEDLSFQNDMLGWLRFHDAMMIGEVIPLLYEYLRSNPAAPERSEYTHILVDEFQDLNRVEQAVLEMLADNANVCIVGDDDQSIYSFKHAHPEGILEWADSNPNADDLDLVDCYRCPIKVAEIANSLIRHNQLRPAPRFLNPIAANGDGDVRIVQYNDLDDEVVGVANTIAQMIASGIPAGDILVLAQRGAIGTPIYEALIARQVPTRSYYAEAELSSVKAQRSFSVLRLLVEREDRVALRWLVGMPGSNWNAAGYSRIREYCEATGISPWDAFEQLASGVLNLPYTNNIVQAFEELVIELGALELLPDIEAIVEELFPSGDNDIRDLRDLALALIDELEDCDIKELLQGLQEKISQPEIPSEIEDVRIMSLHKSKGLSAPVTIIAGCIEGLLPSRPDSSFSHLEVQRQLEEQRRLFFVGISRVKAAPAEGKPGTLLLTYSKEMPVAQALGSGISPASSSFGIANLNASRFISELGPFAPTPVAG